MSPTPNKPAQSMSVYRADDFTVINGANLGDAMSFADELDLGDVYELRRDARQHRLSLGAAAAGHFTVAPDTRLGLAGATVYLDSCITLMSGTGETAELLLFVEVDPDGNAAEVFVLPLVRLTPRRGYSLVGIDRAGARTRFAEVACVAFTRGTSITLASGEQRPVEALHPGDMVLTRDDGSRPLRWIGQSTARAVGDFAPIRIRAGALNNAGDLLVSPDHRLFIYQRSDALGAGRNEVLVRARHLLNGETVVQVDGGFVDYFQLLFDEHQIVYAEGIAAETLLVDMRTRDALPSDLTDRLASSLPEHGLRPHLDFEVGEKLLDHPDTAALLKRASTR
ncbi:MAG: Hint domain-containing protein [Roseovarius sp.]|nr:Hint domain-containing protein [Roseovarius sp.]